MTMRIHQVIGPRTALRSLACVALAMGVCACDRSQPAANVGSERSEMDAAAPTNRIDIPPMVRQNLGITFAKVESRAVSRTLRVPGRFELLPTARREYRAAASGIVELLVEQYQQVRAGTPVYRLDSPRWRELQSELAEAQAQVLQAEAELASLGPFFEAHEKHHEELQVAVGVWSDRVSTLEKLQTAGAARGEDLAQARASLAAARTAFAETLEKEAELNARQAEVTARLASSNARQSILLDSAAMLSGLPATELAADDGGKPRWRTLDRIEVSANADGVVDALHAVTGSFVDVNGQVLTIVQPQAVRFRAMALQSDLGRVRDGMRAMVVPPRGGSLSNEKPIACTLTLAPTAQPDRRMIDLIAVPDALRADPTSDTPLPGWARPGVSAFLEVMTEGDARHSLAIPLAAVVRDGTQSIIFRRDPRNPDKAIRMEADLGVDDGRWIAINSGVAEGNEVVVDGVYQLMVATSGTITRGGHFHADGTFHEGDD